MTGKYQTTSVGCFDERAQQLKLWLQQQPVLKGSLTLQVLPGDAGFRRYFRILVDGTQKSFYLAVDAPPATENGPAIVALQQEMLARGLRLPEILATDLEQGWMLVEDLGDQLLASQLKTNTALDLYQRALDELPKLYQTPLLKYWQVSSFVDKQLLYEMEMFQHWFLQVHLQLQLSDSEQKMLDQVFMLLLQNAKEQPQVLMHRDYHSRNLIVLSDQKIAILDWQDAMMGPVCYDAVSLLRDCYVRWPKSLVDEAKHYFFTQIARTLRLNYEIVAWNRWFDLTGIQRHLKAIFIFARKYHRDHQSRYLPDIDRALLYLQEVVPEYPEFAEFNQFLQQRVISKMQEVNLSCAQ